MNPWHLQQSGCFFFPFKEEMWWESQYNIKEEDLSTVNDSVSSAWSILFPRSSASVLPQTSRRLPQSIKEDDEPRASRDISDCWWRRPALYLRSRWGFLHSSFFLFLGREDKTFQEHISLLTQKVDTCLRWKPFLPVTSDPESLTAANHALCEVN